jgi:hypothetical protein
VVEKQPLGQIKMGRSARDSQKNQPSDEVVFCGDRVRKGVSSDAQGSIDSLRALQAPSAAPFVERNVLQMYQLRQQLPFAALAPVRSLVASFQRHCRTATRTEAATDSRNEQTKGWPKLSLAGHITPRFRQGTFRWGGKTVTGGGALRQGRRVGPRMGPANELPLARTGA